MHSSRTHSKDIMLSLKERTLGFLRCYSTMLIVLLPPLIFLPLPLLVEGQESQAGYLLILMVIYWCTEVVPLSVTALLPVFMLPLFGILSAKEVTSSYMENSTFLVIGGLIIAVGIENCNLHRRIAINAILRIGVSPRWLMIGFMLPTWLLAMCICNTPATAMMLPIVEEVLRSLDQMREEKESAKPKEDEKAEQKCSTETRCAIVSHMEDSTDNLMLTLEPKGLNISSISLSNKTVPLETDLENEIKINLPKTHGKSQEDTSRAQFGKALVISVAYAANCGGVATLFGTPVNPMLQGQADRIWKEKGCDSSPINFASWMVIGLPISILNFLVVWIWLELIFVGFKGFCGKEDENQKQEKQIIKEILKREHAKLGPMKTSEIQTCILFLCFILLLFFRDPGFITGWNSLVGGKTSDATLAIFVAFLFFVIPERHVIYSEKKVDSLVTWKSMKQKFGWHIIFLLGGGYALANAITTSGLSDLLGLHLSVLEDLPGPVLVIVFGLIITIVTQFTSNTAAASIFFSITLSMTDRLGKNPLYLMFPVAFCAQFAFMLPVATPPNALAYSTGRLTVLDFVKSGTFLNLACTLVMTLAIFTWGDAYFDFNELPWDKCNSTIALLK